MSVLGSKLPVSTFQKAVITGNRYDGKKAAEAGMVHVTYPMGSEQLEEGTKKAMEYKITRWSREVYQALKKEMCKTAVKDLEDGGLGLM